MSEPRSILIVKLGAVGDCIHTLVAMHALREAFPQAKLGWLVEGKSREVVLGHPDLDHVHVWNRKQTSADFFAGHPLRAWAEIRRVVGEMRAVGYEIAIDFQNLFKSGFFTWQSGAPLRLGYGRLREGNFFFTNRRVAIASSEIHMVRRYLALLAPLGLSIKDDPPAVPIFVPEQAEEKVDAWWREHIGEEEKVVAINPAASLARKLWPVDRYAQAGAHLRQNLGALPLLIWGPGEEKLVEQVAAKMNGSALIAPPTTIKELAHLLSKCRIYLGNDTGPMHLAAAMGIGVVGLFGPSNPLRVGPWTSKARSVEPDVPFAKNRDILGLSVDKVVAAVTELWDSQTCTS